MQCGVALAARVSSAVRSNALFRRCVQISRNSVGSNPLSRAFRRRNKRLVCRNRLACGELEQKRQVVLYVFLLIVRSEGIWIVTHLGKYQTAGRC